MLIFGYWVKTIQAGFRFAAPAGNENGNPICNPNHYPNFTALR